jgi:DNA-directed RNA polymerase specialized sigma24 family protein
LEPSNSVVLQEPSWGEHALALRQARRTRRRGWLTTPPALLERARALDPPAVASLCERYRHSVRNFLRGRGVSHDLAEDVTQGYFERVIDRKSFAQVDPERGLGVWLRRGAFNYLCNERTRELTAKRLLDERKANEVRAELEARRATTAERALDQQRAKLRAKQLVDKAWAKLRVQYARSGNEDLFEHLRKTLLLEATETTDAELCLRLGHSSTYVAVARHRLRNRDFPAAIMAELKDARSRTAQGGAPSPLTPRTLRDEIRALLDALS